MTPKTRFTSWDASWSFGHTKHAARYRVFSHLEVVQAVCDNKSVFFPHKTMRLVIARDLLMLVSRHSLRILPVVAVGTHPETP